jgi:hypothetical protein
VNKKSSQTSLFITFTVQLKPETHKSCLALQLIKNRRRLSADAHLHCSENFLRIFLDKKQAKN